MPTDLHCFHIDGPPAFPASRAERLLARLRDVEPGVAGVQASYRHFVLAQRAATAAELDRLAEVLEYGEAGVGSRAAALEWIVIPRPGTVSPWSSKATDIVRHCGFDWIDRVERGVHFRIAGACRPERLAAVQALVHDRMTEAVVPVPGAAEVAFGKVARRPQRTVALGSDGRAALSRANVELGLALSAQEIEYLVAAFGAAGRDPTDAELMMFAQVNSEHCRHKIFNAGWTIDGRAREHSLFDLIRATHAAAPQGTLVAYSDNAAVIEGSPARRFAPAGGGPAEYRHEDETLHIVFKVETHNHPTAISPFAGAATGSGGEIRDESATGRGARPKAGLCGFSVSNLRLDGMVAPWETDADAASASPDGSAGQADFGFPGRIADARTIMIEGPIGAASFNNEFGRPNLLGYFRVYQQNVGGVRFGYHKPIMIAGGIGSIREPQVRKAAVAERVALVQLGGPGMRIGLGGGAASSVGGGANEEALDFDSVQRGNPEMQRRAQEVIDRCAALGPGNPILSIHDVGAGGLSNALPELVHADGCGAVIDLKAIPVLDGTMSPLEIWCNESQERYVLAVDPARLAVLEALCARERCPIAVVGRATQDGRLRVAAPDHEPAVDMPMDALLGRLPRMQRQARSVAVPLSAFDASAIEFNRVAIDVLRHPTVGSKSFLITIGDRTVGGLCSRDQMVGPWQVPVADCAVTLADFEGYAGEAMAMGERAPLAVEDAAAASRVAIAEALLNLAAADVDFSRVKLSANWMAACGADGQDAQLYRAVEAASDLCRAIGVAIPVGKDSLSMSTRWRDGSGDRQVRAPVSLVVSAAGRVGDVRRSLTPQLRLDVGPTDLILVDLSAGKLRLGGSVLAQVCGRYGQQVPDIDDAASLQALLAAIRRLEAEGELLAYHDRSDGGLWACACEMAFAAACGVSLYVDVLAVDPLAQDAGDFRIRSGQVEARRADSLCKALFSEEPGCLIQVRRERRIRVMEVLRQAGLGALSHCIGSPNETDVIEAWFDGRAVVRAPRADAMKAWSEVSWRIARQRDNAACADAEYEGLPARSALSVRLGFDPAQDIAAPFIRSGVRPRLAILREQGVNSQYEMAAAFDRAGFSAVDVHMTDLLDGRESLSRYHGFAACGGFSYGDVLGGGGGWAKTILFNARLFDEFSAFFSRGDSFALGVCNGCQMMSQLKRMIPGAGDWPRFLGNESEQFEARLVMVEVAASPSIFFDGMAGSRMPIANAHGEGRARFDSEESLRRALVSLRYVDGDGRPATRYPDNPNGSPAGITGLTTPDGRFTVLMPHPERVRRTVQLSWRPPGLGEDSPWMRMFRNARRWVG